jgi:hypothetical protein
MAPDPTKLYRALMEANPKEMAVEHGKLRERLTARNCLYKGQPFPMFMMPHFISKEQNELLTFACQNLISAVEKVTHLYFSDPVFADSFGLSPGERVLMEIPPLVERKIVLCRPDGFLAEGREQAQILSFIEINADSPAGMVDGDILSEEFLALSPMDEVRKHYAIEHDRMKERYLAVLLSKWREFGGTESPQIGIIDWDEVQPRTEFYLLAEFFESHGHPSKVGDPRALEFRDGKLYLGDFRVDLVVRRVITRELAEKLDEVKGFVDAARAGAVCIVNPFRSKLASFKGIFNVLTNPEHHHLFTRSELDVIDKHIPWTRQVEPGRVDFHGEVLEMEKLLAKHKERIVLKPTHGYAGKDVFVGMDCPEAEWSDVSAKALAGKSNYIAQEYVPIPEAEFPAFAPDLVFVPKKVNINPFVLDGAYAGCMSRVSDSSIINLARGGGQQPTFVCVDR